MGSGFGVLPLLMARSAQRQEARAIELLREAGKTPEEIAALMGYDKPTLLEKAVVGAFKGLGWLATKSIEALRDEGKGSTQTPARPTETLTRGGNVMPGSGAPPTHTVRSPFPQGNSGIISALQNESASFTGDLRTAANEALGALNGLVASRIGPASQKPQEVAEIFSAAHGLVEMARAAGRTPDGAAAETLKQYFSRVTSAADNLLRHGQAAGASPVALQGAAARIDMALNRVEGGPC